MWVVGMPCRVAFAAQLPAAAEEGPCLSGRFLDAYFPGEAAQVPAQWGGAAGWSDLWKRDKIYFEAEHFRFRADSLIISYLFRGKRDLKDFSHPSLWWHEDEYGLLL